MLINCKNYLSTGKSYILARPMRILPTHINLRLINGRSTHCDAAGPVSRAGAEYPQIWHMLAYRSEAAEHLSKFTQTMLREEAPLSPGLRELIAAYTSSQNQCPF